MDMNVTAGVRAYVIRENCFCLAMFAAALALTLIPKVDVLAGTCDVLTNFYLRLFRLSIPPQLSNPKNDKLNLPEDSWKFYVYKIPGFFIMVSIPYP